jgi:hypothetical protein
VSFEDRKVLLGHKTQDVTTHYSAAEIGMLIAAAERVCDLAERASPAIAVVRRSGQPDGAKSTVPAYYPGEAPAKQDDDTPADVHPSIFHNSLMKAASQLAKDNGVSLDQFIATAVAEKVDSLRRAQEPLLAATTPRFSGPVTGNPHCDNDLIFGARMRREVAEGGIEPGDSRPGWDDMRYWRWPSVTPPPVRRAEIIKRRAAKFPWIDQTDS